jgi:hypothetical protein
VYTVIVVKKRSRFMKNITFSADEQLIEAAREQARAEHTTLNEKFRHWLKEYSRGPQHAEEAARTVRKIQRYARTGGKKFTREEMNER